MRGAARVRILIVGVRAVIIGMLAGVGLLAHGLAVAVRGECFIRPVLAPCGLAIMLWIVVSLVFRDRARLLLRNEQEGKGNQPSDADESGRHDVCTRVQCFFNWIKLNG